MVCKYLLSVCTCMLSHLSHVWICATPWTGARQAPLSMGVSRREYWSGVLFPPPGDLPDPRIKLVSHLLPWRVGSLPLAPPGKHPQSVVFSLFFSQGLSESQSFNFMKSNLPNSPFIRHVFGVESKYFLPSSQRLYSIFF